MGLPVLVTLGVSVALYIPDEVAVVGVPGVVHAATPNSTATHQRRRLQMLLNLRLP